ncbi:hypothetical protein [Mucilaginibacter polytrichastri]|uniref:Uncharacterized protein n=1 Tax=Mucilaginibacter polytrichastri TaxID=1302689 RepID=A0A1Q5ZXN2_9SPHI|nr:hypothetical protein [Mucilaginibacter polytrichastri]OKS86511.1 hypothetical protein RG47T_1967 [Mucilaginibacter polytrichastri]SFS79267.1 hypothetical protein SAMN04487890_10485 [Mucilaginibacter polytrichastri]
MIKPVSIEKKNLGMAMDFAALREHGIKMIQQMCGDVWTDYNLHDPGVTILEQLCFAITDLAYRTSFPLPDLLSDRNGVVNYEKNSFFTKDQILTSNPVTINDFRKVIIDEISEIDNVWLYPVTSSLTKNSLKGLYKIVVQVKRDVANNILNGTETEERIADLVRGCFNDKRSLCEDMRQEIVILKAIKITIEADIQISKQLVPEETLAHIYRQIERTINMPVKHYSEKELLDKGYPIENIYSGPILKNGFIPDSELKEKSKLIDPAELSKNISQINGVVSVKKLIVNGGDNNNNSKPFAIDPNRFLLFDIKASEPLIKLYSDNYEVPMRNSVFRSLLQKIRESSDRGFIASIYKKLSQGVDGTFRNPEAYYSIQYLFPHIYGIGEEGLVHSEPSFRKAQAKQLKGYLLFFEQIIANYLSQLANIGEVFSNEYNRDSKTYYSQPLYNLPGAEHLFKAFTDTKAINPAYRWDNFINEDENAYTKALNSTVETDESAINRKNVMFDHLLARFNEFLIPYPLKLYTALYTPDDDTGNAERELEWKSGILKDIANIGYNRAISFNYLKNADDQTDRRDFVWKMNQLLYTTAASNIKPFSEALNTDMVRLEKAKKATHQPVVSDDSEEANWVLDMPRIVLSKNEVEKMVTLGLLKDDAGQADSFSFNNQEISVLKYALDIKNYRIGPGPSIANGHLLMYKPPHQKIWSVISKHADSAKAIIAAKNLIGFLKDINIQSEGFYLVEHILLRPYLNEKAFGFKFHKSKNEILLASKSFSSFESREELITDIVKSAAAHSRDEVFSLCNPGHIKEPVLTAEAYQKHSELMSSLVKCHENHNHSYPCFEGVIRADNDLVVSESFFNFRISIVFPAWPARFQDKSFRDHAEKLFRLHIPAHITPLFKWLGIAEMKAFEPLYFDWLNFLTASEGANKNAKANLIRFLAGDGKSGL